jgi:hypothetical protein
MTGLPRTGQSACLGPKSVTSLIICTWSICLSPPLIPVSFCSLFSLDFLASHLVKVKASLRQVYVSQASHLLPRITQHLSAVVLEIPAQHSRTCAIPGHSPTTSALLPISCFISPWLLTHYNTPTICSRLGKQHRRFNCRAEISAVAHCSPPATYTTRSQHHITSSDSALHHAPSLFPAHARVLIRHQGPRRHPAIGLSPACL